MMPIARGSPVFLLPLLLALFPSFLSPLLRLRDPGVCLSLVRKKRPFGSLKQRPKRKKTTKKKEESIEAVRSIACPVQGAGDLNLNLFRKNQFFLKNRQGKYVVLFFYPLDFTFVCPTGKEKSGERREEEIESEGERRERKRRASERGSLERNRAQPFPPPPPSKRKKKKTDLSKTQNRDHRLLRPRLGVQGHRRRGRGGLRRLPLLAPGLDRDAAREGRAGRVRVPPGRGHHQVDLERLRGAHR